MNGLLGRVVNAVVVGIVTGVIVAILLIVLNSVIAGLTISPNTWGTIMGLLAGLYVFSTGKSLL